ncbi:MAG: hypothetical protein M3Q39_13595 [Actinomycetota bacterium]|nr:hypothetical protein [Actinomycetota bacterium]
MTAACPECRQEWPQGTPGYLDSDGWHNGARPPPASRRPPNVVRAEEKADRAQAVYDAARAEWQRCASEHYSARHRSTSEATTVVDSGGRLREVGPISPATLTALADAEDAAKVAMDAAGSDLVEARMKHRDLVAARAGQ